jgi:hypothetical protein
MDVSRDCSRLCSALTFAAAWSSLSVATSVAQLQDGGRCYQQILELVRLYTRYNSSTSAAATPTRFTRSTAI